MGRDVADAAFDFASKISGETDVTVHRLSPSDELIIKLARKLAEPYDDEVDPNKTLEQLRKEIAQIHVEIMNRARVLLKKSTICVSAIAYCVRLWIDFQTKWRNKERIVARSIAHHPRFRGKSWSERGDSNSRPLAPEAKRLTEKQRFSGDLRRKSATKRIQKHTYRCITLHRKEIRGEAQKMFAQGFCGLGAENRRAVHPARYQIRRRSWVIG